MKRIDGVYISEFEHIDMISNYAEYIRQAKSQNTYANYLSSLDAFLDFMGVENEEDIRKIELVNVRKYQTFLLKKGVSNESVNAYFRNLKSTFKILKSDKYVDENPFDSETLGLKEKKNKEIVILDESEVYALLQAAKNPEDRLIYALLLTTGVRREELCKIKKHNVQGYLIKLEAEDTKSNREDHIAMTPQVEEMYLEFLEWQEEKFKGQEINYPNLFISKMRKPYTGNSIWLKFKTALKNAGFSEERQKELSPHKCRHTFVTNFLVENGGNIAVTQMAARHASPATTSRYAHLAEEKMLDLMHNQKRIGEAK